MDAEQKSFFAIIPANVRYDKELTPNAKLLFAEITAMTNERGYCWASNSYFSNLYGVDKKTISKWVSTLEKKDYIKTELIYKENSKEIQQRRIYLSAFGTRYLPGGYGKNNGDLSIKNRRPIHEIMDTPIHEITEDNNKVFNNKFNNKKEKNIKKKPTDVDFQNIFTSYTTNENLLNTLNDFLEMRKTLKPYPTLKAIQLIVNKLDKIATNDLEKIQILEKSIIYGWKGIFPLNNKTIKGEKQNAKSFRVDEEGNKRDEFGLLIF